METKAYAAKRAQLEQLIREKDEYIAEFRKQALALRAELEAHDAEKAVKDKVKAMSPAERLAMADALKEG